MKDTIFIQNLKCSGCESTIIKLLSAFPEVKKVEVSHEDATVQEANREHPILKSLRNIVTEPMFLLLAVACALYFFLGDLTEAIMMIVSILFVLGIELYQETKSERVPADGLLLVQNDLFVDESVLTGESLPVQKTVHGGESGENASTIHTMFQGTTIASGKGVFKVSDIGAGTSFGNRRYHSNQQINSKSNQQQMTIITPYVNYCHL